MKRRISKKKLVRNILLLTSFLLISATTAILIKSDFSPQAIIHENIYLWLSTKRDTEIYTIYKDISETFVEVEMLQSISNYNERSIKATEIQQEVIRLKDELNRIQTEYDDKLTALKVSQALEVQAKGYDSIDSKLSQQLSATKTYLEKEIVVNNYLLAKSNILACYQSIPSTASKQSLATINKCLKQNSLVKLPDIDGLEESKKYQTLVEDYLQASYKLHNYLLNDDAENGEKQRIIVISKFSSLNNQNVKSNQELEKQLVLQYNKIEEVYGVKLPN